MEAAKATGPIEELDPHYREKLFALINVSPFVRHMAMTIRDLGWGQNPQNLQTHETPKLQDDVRPKLKVSAPWMSFVWWLL
jgi:hypothetical protein